MGKKKKANGLQEDIHVDLTSCNDEIFDEKKGGSDFEESEEEAQRHAVPFSVLVAELEGYIYMPNIERKEDPYVWWKQHKSAFPRMSDLAKQYLSKPASSVCSERVFSEAGNISKRNAHDFCQEMEKN